MIRITTRRARASVAFPYDEEGVDIIRSIPGRRWDSTARYWTVPEDEVRLTATRFHAAGFDVLIDGEMFTPRTSASPRRTNPLGDPMLAFFRVLPVALRQPAYRALARVLHPDAGGDTALMQQLNRANKETR